ncbi:MAG: hypothetical protein ACR2RF_25025 [Geminicoccaceae bacterium]
MGHLYRFLDTTGDGTGTKNANVDGSSTAVTFRYNPGSGDRTEIARMIVHIEDAAPFSADEYGNLGAALTNGVLVQIRKYEDNATVIDLCDGLPVKSNSQWSRMCYDMDTDSFGAGNDHVKIRWTFAKSGSPLYIQDDEYFCIVVQDNLTGLVEHYFMIQGMVEHV